MLNQFGLRNKLGDRKIGRNCTGLNKNIFHIQENNVLLVIFQLIFQVRIYENLLF